MLECAPSIWNNNLLATELFARTLKYFLYVWFFVRFDVQLRLGFASSVLFLTTPQKIPQTHRIFRSLWYSCTLLVCLWCRCGCSYTVFRVAKLVKCLMFKLYFVLVNVDWLYCYIVCNIFFLRTQDKLNNSPYNRDRQRTRQSNSRSLI